MLSRKIFNNLKVLCLRKYEINVEGMKELTTAKFSSTTLTSLALPCNGNEGLELISKSMKNLQSLDLYDNNIDDDDGVK